MVYNNYGSKVKLIPANNQHKPTWLNNHDQNKIKID